MKKMYTNATLFLLAITISACGNMYPFSAQRDLQRSDDARKAASAENAKLKEQNQTYIGYLKDIYVTDHFDWVWTGAFESYEEAISDCSIIGYQLPDQSAFNEFVSELYNKKPDWQTSVKEAQIHISGVTTSLQQGFVVCEKAKN